MLERVRYRDYCSGIEVNAYTNGYAYDQYFSVYLLSVAGYDSSVKAITSALVSGKTVEILSRNPLDLGTAFGQKCRVLGTKLGSGLLHQIVLDDGFFRSHDARSKLLYIHKDELAPLIVYDTIKRGCSVPLIPGWSQWLYRRMKEENGIEELSDTDKVLKLTFGEEELDSMVSEGIRNGEIDF